MAAALYRNRGSVVWCVGCVFVAVGGEFWVGLKTWGSGCSSSCRRVLKFGRSTLASRQPTSSPRHCRTRHSSLAPRIAWLVDAWQRTRSRLLPLDGRWKRVTGVFYANIISIPADEVEIVFVEELGNHFCAECITHTAIILAPALCLLVRIWPQQIAEETLVGNVFFWQIKLMSFFL